MKISDLTPNAQNPRIVTDRKLAQLKKNILKLGDLSGIVFNKKSRRLVTGHQRLKLVDDSNIVITKKYPKPTKTGTVAEGWFVSNGERFAYREVYWNEHLEKAANIAANKGAGEWDVPKLNTWLKELSDFDIDFDLDLTMFDAKELSDLPSPIEVSAHTRDPNSKKSKADKLDKPPKCKTDQVYALGEARLKCGGDLHFCDRVIALWEKHSGQEVVLMPKTTVKQSKKQPILRHAKDC